MASPAAPPRQACPFAAFIEAALADLVSAAPRRSPIKPACEAALGEDVREG
jgi:hypothetical protein